MGGFESVKEKYQTMHRNNGDKRSPRVVLCRLILVAGAIFFGALAARPAEAATLYSAPSSGTFSVGDTFTLGVYASSPDQALNAVSGVLNVPRDKLQIMNVAAGSSIVNLWVRDPSFSAAAGTASFEGIVLNPGFRGSGGQIMILTLKAVGPGVATVNFNSGVVLANDGLGTNILRGMGSAQFTIIGADVSLPSESETEPTEEESLSPSPSEEPPEPESEPPRMPTEPVYTHEFVISSETHPREDAWYTSNDVKLFWELPKSATAVRLLVSRNPDDVPTVLYDPPIDSIELKGLEDGVWYLHVQLHVSPWSEVERFQFKIDTHPPPAFELVEIPRTDPTDPIVRFNVDATDPTSGVDHYDIYVDGQIGSGGLDGALTSLPTPALKPGEHTISVHAVDRAGNEREAAAQVRVEALTAPVILQYPLSLEYGDVFFVRGTTVYPDARVVLWIQGKEREPIYYDFRSDSEGNIHFLTKERLPKGEVEVWLVVYDERGAQSDPSERVVVTVQGLLLSDLWPWLSYTLLIIVGILVYILRRNWCQLAALRKQLKGGGGNEGYAELERELVALRKEVEKTERVRRKARPSRRTSRPGTKARVRRKPSSAASGKKYIIGNWRGKKQAE